MSEDNNRPPSINLEELERQLREALSRRSSASDATQAGSGQEDPLSMLARLVEHEGASKQAQSQPVQAAPEVPAYPAPEASYQAPSAHEPSPSYAAYDPSAYQPAAPVTESHYQPHDHLVFDPNQYAPQAASHQDHSPEPQSVTPAGFNSHAPYQSASYQEPAYQEPVYQAAAPQAPAAPEPAHSPDAYAPYVPPQPVTPPPAPSYEAYQPASATPAAPSTAPAAEHDVWSLAASEMRPGFENGAKKDALSAASASEAALAGLAGLTARTEPVMSAPEPQPAPSYQSPKAPDASLIYSSSFPEREKREDQWGGTGSKGVGLSYSEAEANLDGEARPAEPQAKPRGRGMMILLALATVAAGGVGIVYYLRGEGARVPSGPPPVIVADKTPVKVVPANPGGTEVPNQGAAIYQPNKVENPKDAKVVSTDEKPVDVSQAPRPAGSSIIGEPKKIRTVTVRLDGSVVDESTVPAGAAVPNAAATPRAAPSMVTIVPPIPVQNPAPAAPAPQPAPAPQVAAPAPAPQAQVPQTANVPTPPVRVMPPARPQTATPAPAPAPQQAQAAAERPASGDYSIQFSAPPSEADAQSAIAGLKRTQAALLGGLNIVAVKGDSNGRTVYRVRAVGLGQEEAISICGKLKASGGDCFVARN